MTKRPHPRHYTHEEQFISARMDHAAAVLPQVTRYDDYAAATGKRAAIAQAREEACEAARETWADWLEYASEIYERGIGPAWN